MGKNIPVFLIILQCLHCEKYLQKKKKLNQESMFHEDVEDKVTLKPTDYD